ncbi:MAG TPA: site-specific DNA-methyltransferase [Anaerolineales bacterium]|nr:site-specific DNA-methyltransferase [Anaerolineales bacterium]
MGRIRIAEHFDPSADVVLYQGDCLDLLREIPAETVTLVVTSPPYNVGKPYEKRLALEEYVAQQQQVIEESVRVLKPNGSICWQVGNYVHQGEVVPLDILLYPIFKDLGLKLRNRIVWAFGHGLHARKRLSGRYEVVLWFTKSDDYIFHLDAIRVPQKYPNKRYFKGPKKGELSGHPLGKNPGDVWEIPNVKANHVEKTQHPAQFPVELIERLVLALTDPGDWVLDPFIGSGTTAIAALLHGRRVVGADIVPEYLAIARERLRLGEQGLLRVRPLERPVYDPNNPRRYVPPKQVRLVPVKEWRATAQLPLFSTTGKETTSPSPREHEP